MKKIILLASLSILVLNVYAQDAKYFHAMGTNLVKLGQAKTEADYQAVANQFELIANKETSQWLPQYYTAQAYINMASVVETDKVDQLLDKAQKFIDKALEINQNESEIHTLQGMLHQGRIRVGVMSRGMEYSGKANKCFAKAKELNPENPRPYFLIAMNVNGTPTMFGGGKKRALPLFETAKTKFDNYQPASPIAPNWGAKMNNEMIEICKK